MPYLSVYNTPEQIAAKYKLKHDANLSFEERHELFTIACMKLKHNKNKNELKPTNISNNTKSCTFNTSKSDNPWMIHKIN